jgi:hypothetical protein
MVLKATSGGSCLSRSGRPSRESDQATVVLEGLALVVMGLEVARDELGDQVGRERLAHTERVPQSACLPIAGASCPKNGPTTSDSSLVAGATVVAVGFTREVTRGVPRAVHPGIAGEIVASALGQISSFGDRRRGSRPK